MSSKINKWLAILMFIPTFGWANPLQVKASAPDVYVVKEGDTLWDIAGMYLDQPWQWPELWRTNTHLKNPHLIYPGDQLRFSYNEHGEPVLQVIRDGNKKQIKLTPRGRVANKGRAISVLPWSVIAPYLQRDRIMSQQQYDAQPYLLGDGDASLRFANGDTVLTGAAPSNTDFYVVRKQNEVFDLHGNLLGYQVRHVADAKRIPSELKEQVLVSVTQAKFEAKRGDKLLLAEDVSGQQMTLVAAEAQQGHIVDNLEQRTLLGKYDVAVLDLGQSEVKPGTVMGIYQQGPAIMRGEQPKYEGEDNPLKSFFSIDGKIQQPAIKIGELVVFKVFEKASYALITGSSSVIREGAIVAAP